MIFCNCPGAFLKYDPNDYNIGVSVETKGAIFLIVRDNRAALRKSRHHKQDIQPSREEFFEGEAVKRLKMRRIFEMKFSRSSRNK
jgi:hypothetical protein